MEKIIVRILSKNKDNIIPYYFVLFFIIIAFLDSIFVFIAFYSFRGVIIENSYEKGLKYNQTIIASEKQELLNWKSRIELKDETIIFYLQDKKNKNLIEGNVRAYFKLVSQVGYDFYIPLFFDANAKVYKNKVNFPFKGEWDIRILVELNKTKYQKTKRIIVN